MLYQAKQHAKQHRAGLWLALALTAGLAVTGQAQQNEPAGAKSLFYNPATGAASRPAQPARKPTDRRPRPAPAPEDKVLVSNKPGLHYWFELEGVGKVSEDRVFYTGERLRLHLRTNLDGYLTLWAYDPAGGSHLLFPAPSVASDNKALSFSEESNYVRANTEYSPGVIQFSPPAADERLLIFFAQSKDDVPAPQHNSLTPAQISQAAEAEGNKSLVFEVEKKDPATFGSYVANRQGGGIAKEIRLKHRARN
jgi:hypothetical protein